MILSPRLASFSKADGKSRIYIYAYDPITRKKDMIPTPLYVDPKYWDGDRVDKKAPGASFINPQLNKIVLDLQAIVNKNPRITPSQLKTRPDANTYTPVTYFRHYIELCNKGEIVRKDTKEKMKAGYTKALGTSAGHLERFAKKHKVTWEALGEDFFDRYVNFLREQNYKQNFIAKSITHFLTIIRHAKKKGLHDIDVDYTVQKEKTQKIRLTPSEVQAMIDVDLTEWPELKVEHERFQIAYALLVRFGDSVEIKEENVVKREGRYYLSAHTIKGKKEIFLPIKESVYQILKRNKFKMQGSNSASNEKLKKIGLLAGIKDKVTITEFRNGKKTTIQKQKYELLETHTTRRSAARNLFDSGMPPEIIMTLGGWSNMKQLLEYIDIDLDYAASKAAEHPFFA